MQPNKALEFVRSYKSNNSGPSFLSEYIEKALYTLVSINSLKKKPFIYLVYLCYLCSHNESSGYAKQVQ
jgi:hypothetical protein